METMDYEDDRPRRSGTRTVFFLALVLVLGVAGAYVYATNYNGFRDVVTSVRESVEPALAPEVAASESAPNPEVERLTHRIADLELRSAVRDALRQYPELRGAAVRVSVEDAVVTLDGTVPASGWKYAAERLAGETEGVVQVDNAITVLPPEEEPAADEEQVDRRLARRVEFELYATEAFDLEQLEVTASGGDVRLGGSVRSLAERLLAERITSEMSGVATVTSELEIVASTPPTND